MSAAALIYRLFAEAALPFIRARLHERHAAGLSERQGFYSGEKLAAAGNGAVWVHAVSVGEVQAASPLIPKIAAMGRDVLLSTVTETGARMASQLIGDSMAAHIYAPWDVPSIVRRACDALRPSAYITVETEVWPNLLTELKKRAVPLILANARISDRTFARAAAYRKIFHEIYDLFDIILARDDEDARRLSAMGVSREKLRVTGDMKIDAMIERKRLALPNADATRKRIAPNGEAIFVAGSTHEGEDEEVLGAFGELLSDYSARAKLVIAPRHPERAQAVMQLARRYGAAEVFSRVGEGTDADIIVVDVIGALFDLYGAAAASFIGGSVVPKGGQNILEPAIWGVPVLHGCHMEDFAAPTESLDRSGAAYLINTREDIAKLWSRTASNDPSLRRGGAEDYISRNAGASERAIDILGNIL
ncbi:3-deoxy-D-manno-octulosonic acid transferase [Synergistales bacterium]|nr:3-deoxy-D-manno-octulosonic acid transferase [Synergistales bacterium]